MVVPVRNGARTLEAALRPLREQLQPGDELLVVDDGSRDESARIAAGYGRVIRVVEGRGAAAARNRGAGEAQGEVLLFVDGDVVVARDALERVRSTLAASSDVDAVQGYYAPRSSDTDLCTRYKHLWIHATFASLGPEIGFVAGFVVAIRREVFRRVGGFAEALQSTEGVEDIDLGRRLHTTGARIRLDHGLLAIHLKRYRLRDLVANEYRRSRGWVRQFGFEGGLRDLVRTRRFANIPGGFLLAIVALGAALLALSAHAFWAAIALGLVWAGLSGRFLALCARTWGMGFAAASVPLSLLDHLACGIGAVVGTLQACAPAEAPWGVTETRRSQRTSLACLVLALGINATLLVLHARHRGLVDDEALVASGSPSMAVMALVEENGKLWPDFADWSRKPRRERLANQKLRTAVPIDTQVAIPQFVWLTEDGYWPLALRPQNGAGTWYIQGAARGLLGGGILAHRALPILVSLLQLVCAWLLARRVGSERVAAVTVLLLAVDYPTLYPNQMGHLAHNFMQLMPWLICLWAIGIGKRLGAARTLVGATLAAVALHTHLISAWFLVAAGLAMLAHGRPLQRVQLRRLGPVLALVGAAAIVVLGAGVYILMLQHFGSFFWAELSPVTHRQLTPEAADVPTLLGRLVGTTIAVIRAMGGTATLLQGWAFVPDQLGFDPIGAGLGAAGVLMLAVLAAKREAPPAVRGAATLAAIYYGILCWYSSGAEDTHHLQTLYCILIPASAVALVSTGRWVGDRLPGGASLWTALIVGATVAWGTTRAVIAARSFETSLVPEFAQSVQRSAFEDVRERGYRTVGLLPGGYNFGWEVVSRGQVDGRDYWCVALMAVAQHCRHVGSPEMYDLPAFVPGRQAAEERLRSALRRVIRAEVTERSTPLLVGEELFPEEGNYRDRYPLRRLFEEELARAGIRPTRVHDYQNADGHRVLGLFEFGDPDHPTASDAVGSPPATGAAAGASLLHPPSGGAELLHAGRPAPSR